jgi:hypothetical protein
MNTSTDIRPTSGRIGSGLGADEDCSVMAVMVAPASTPKVGSPPQREEREPEDFLSPLDDPLVLEIHIVQATRGPQEIGRWVLSIRDKFLLHAIGVDRERDPRTPQHSTGKRAGKQETRPLRAPPPTLANLARLRRRRGSSQTRLPRRQACSYGYTDRTEPCSDGRVHAGLQSRPTPRAWEAPYLLIRPRPPNGTRGESNRRATFDC